MTKTDIIRSKCIADTLWATRYFFYAQEGRKFNVGEHHKQIATALDRVFAGQCRRLIINCPPRYSKTEMLKAFVKKGLAINPASKYIMLSYSANLALDNSERIKDVVASDWYQDLFPWVNIKKDSHSKQKWYTTAGGGIYATSSDGQVTGFGAGIVKEEGVEDFEIDSTSQWGGAIIIDDPLKPLDASSPVKRQKVNDQFENTIRSRVNDRSTPIIIIMQRLHKQDLCGYLMNLEPEEWDVLSLPALSTDENGVEHALYPHKHTVEELYKIRSANRFTFETQYQQNPQAINEKLWLFAFDRAQHTGHVEYNPNYPLVMSWDFNRNPMTCTLFQHINGQARGIECIRIENSTTRMVCAEIERKYPNAFFLVTGDVAGKNSTTLSLLNNYDVVKAYFNLSKSQMQYSGSNPRLSDSRYFINSLFEQYDIVFDIEKCKPAIFDFENVLADEENKPVKTSRDNVAQQADFLDNVRYYFHRFYKELIPNY
ncbi:MAG: hypothetical protein NC229_08545 [Bacteroides sp.]|nr:hypothetical protein [Bacteroidales bacterium]MCM1068707.1 hypothetical protein [Prevotella sp.]MCM1354693.1 hypothetical protein [Bacteroides sp.]MCM1403759.1 hypothetical protein [Bacteroides sp.]MCM1443523.1 hypothetical protein [Muribaculum sp.]